jgi:hypothetical protein
MVMVMTLFDVGRIHPETTREFGKTYPDDDNVTKGSRFPARLETKPRNFLDDVLGCISKIVWIKLIAFGMASF